MPFHPAMVSLKVISVLLKVPWPYCVIKEFRQVIIRKKFHILFFLPNISGKTSIFIQSGILVSTGITFCSKYPITSFGRCVLHESGVIHSSLSLILHSLSRAGITFNVIVRHYGDLASFFRSSFSCLPSRRERKFVRELR